MTLKWRYIAVIFFFVALLPPAYAEDREDTGLTFAIFPYVSPVQMVKFHNRLREFIQSTVDRPVTLVSAPNFKKFIKRTAAGDYDIIMTAPHLGRLAEVRDGYVPMVHTMHEVQGIYLVRKDSDIRQLQDLKGKTITLVGRAAIITQMVEQQLGQLGLDVGKDVEFRITRTHNNAMYAPLRGESEASVTGILLFNKIGQTDREKVRVIGKTPLAPGFMLMTHKRIDAEVHKKLKQALLGYGDTPAGKVYMNETGFKYFDPVTDDEMRFLDPFIQTFLR